MFFFDVRNVLAVYACMLTVIRICYFK